MEIREQIIQKVVRALEGRVDARTADMIQDVLIMELSNYEVQERSTEVTIVDGSAEKMLKKFLATKRIEGIAESTLHRYADENRKLIHF